MHSASREIEVWGTVVAVEVASETQPQVVLESSIDSAEQYFHHIDSLFSTWKPDSVISQLRRNEIDIDSCSDEIKEAWHSCLEARRLTTGAFDPWAVAGGFDLSGFVKGWAAEKACQLIAAHGVERVLVNAGGDIAMRGGSWQIGVRNPNVPAEVVHTIHMSDGCVATSGTYEKGSHIHDPWTGLIAIGAVSATVWGPAAGICEALSTALIVSGKDGARWFSQPELAEYSAWCIDRNENQSWSISGRDFLNIS